MKIAPMDKMMKCEIEALKDIKINEKIDKFVYPYEYVPEIINDGTIMF